MTSSVLRIITLAFFTISIISFVYFKTNGKTIIHYFEYNNDKQTSNELVFITFKELRSVDSLIQDSIKRGNLQMILDSCDILKSNKIIRLFGSKTFIPFDPDEITEDLRLKDCEKRIQRIVHAFHQKIDLDINQIQAYARSENDDSRYIQVKFEALKANPFNERPNKQERYVIHESILDSIRVLDMDSILSLSKFKNMESKTLNWSDYILYKNKFKFVIFIQSNYPNINLTPNEIIENLWFKYPPKYEEPDW